MPVLQIQFFPFVLSAMALHPIELLEFRKSHRRFPEDPPPLAPSKSENHHIIYPHTPPLFRSKSQNEENVPPIGHVSISSAIGAFDSLGKRLNTDIFQPHSTTSIIYPPPPLQLPSEHKEQAFPFSPPL